MSIQCFADFRNGFFRDGFMNHQGFTGIADTETLCLCIYNDIDRHLNICCLIDIDMAVPGSRLNDRNGTLFHYRANQACASTWDKQVHVLVKTHKFLCRLSGSIFQYLNGICRQTDCVKCLTDYIADCQIRVDRIAAAAKDDCISCLKAECKCICCHIWTGFINDSDDSHRHTFLSDLQSARCRFHGNHFSYRICQGNDLTDSLCHSSNPVFGQTKPVKQCLRHMIFLCFFDILIICG